MGDQGKPSAEPAYTIAPVSSQAIPARSVTVAANRSPRTGSGPVAVAIAAATAAPGVVMVAG